MRHFKILGWLWLLFGGFWSLLLAWAFLNGASITPDPDHGVTVFSTLWWQTVILNTAEGSFFLGSALLGVALLRRWRYAHIAAAILGALTLALYAWLVQLPTNAIDPPLTLTQRMLYLSPLAILGLYSLITVFFVRYEPLVANRALNRRAAHPA